jgi:hypothetical protein
LWRANALGLLRESPYTAAELTELLLAAAEAGLWVPKARPEKPEAA